MYASQTPSPVSSVFVCAMRDESDYGAAYMSDGLRTALGLDPQHGGGIIEGTINAAERLTGWDLDGDGDVGVAGSGHLHHGAQRGARAKGRAEDGSDGESGGIGGGGCDSEAGCGGRGRG